ncbi:hypothetical protein N7494_002693 [Penicillium frequentans]|uniref:Ankyrin n=1 Tax=Penicillium frequentans TaxID=3151616 RepID=A0AAD6GKM5_9EURO|nr:hypothetical protein N7494_002693 [Penicillium glabrum]
MAYTQCHQRHEDFEFQPLIFYDTDGSPVYEGPYQILLNSIIRHNDVTALHLYKNSLHTQVFLLDYDAPYYNPFSVALGCHSFDALRALIDMYLSDSSLTEPLQKYTNRFQLSLIHETCASGNQEMVEWLISHESPLGTLHDRDARGWTPLLYAAEALGEAGNLMVDAEYGESPIFARKRAREKVERLEKLIYWLLDSGSSVSDSTTFETSYDNSLPEESDNMPRIQYTVLGKAIPYASYDMVSHLISKGDGVHAFQRWSSPSQCTGIDYEGDVTLLHIASLFWNLEGIQALIDHYDDIKLIHMVSKADGDGRLPLHWAITGIEDRREEKDNLDEIISRMMSTVRILLDAKPDTINARDHHGATTFHYLAKLGIGPVVIPRAIQTLLSAHPSTDTINGRNLRGETALENIIRSFARRVGTLERTIDLIMSLLGNWADAHSCDNKGRNILHKLCMPRWTQPISTAALDRLLKYVDVNETDSDGCTVLHYLVRNLSQIDAARYLIQRGADPTKKDKKGITPLQEALEGTFPIYRQVSANGDIEPESYAPTERARNELKQVLLDTEAIQA